MTDSETRPNPAARGETFLLILMAIVLPPLPMYLMDKTIFSRNFIVCCLLTLCGGIAGSIFSCYIIYLYLKQDSILEGYTRLGDDEEQQLRAEPQAHREEQAPEAQPLHPHRIHHDEEHTQPDPNQILTASDLPSYDDIVGGSQPRDEYPRDVKSNGDHKVQR